MVKLGAMSGQNEDFLEWVAGEMGRLADEDANLANELRELEDKRQAIAQQRQQLAQRVEQLKTVDAVYQGWKSPGPSNGHDSRVSEAPTPTPIAGDLASMTVADGAEAIMRARGGKATVMDLAATLHAAGKFKDARSGYTVVYPALSKAPTRFRKLDRGTWGLVELFGADDENEAGRQESDGLALDPQRA
jgi:hypothetical protein